MLTTCIFSKAENWGRFYEPPSILPLDAMQARYMLYTAILFVCPSVCLSHLWFVSKRVNMSYFFHHPSFYFSYTKCWVKNSDPIHPRRGVKYKWGMKNSRTTIIRLPASPTYCCYTTLGNKSTA